MSRKPPKDKCLPYPQIQGGFSDSLFLSFSLSQIHSDLKISQIEMEHEDPGIAEIRGSDKSGTIRRIYIGEKLGHCRVI